MPTSVQTRQVKREIQIKEVSPERRAVRGLGGGAGINGQDLLWPRPVKREYGLEYLGVSVRLHTLADGRTELHTHAQQPTGKFGAGRSTSARAEFLRLTRETVRAWCAQAMSFARFRRSVAKSQYARWSRTRLWCPTTPVRSKIVRESHGSLPMCTSLGTRPVAALTELLKANSTWGRCKSQSSCRSLTTIDSISATV